MRFVSYEPALGPVEFHSCWTWPRHGTKLDWIIVGGESGPGARPFDVEWARNTIAQCKAAGVACFVKQLGSDPFRIIQPIGGAPVKVGLHIGGSKGGNWDEWPLDLRVRQFPKDRQRESESPKTPAGGNA